MRNKLWPHSAQQNKSLFIITLFFPITVFSQTITGAVTGDTSKAISSVTVRVKGTSSILVADNAEKYSIESSGKETLVFSSVRFIKHEVSVNGKQSLNVIFDTRNMEGVVVTNDFFVIG